MTKEETEYFLTVAAGNIKVDIRDLVKLFDTLSAGDMEQDFVRFFKKKYLTLTAIREQEKQAYENLKKAKEIAKNPAEYDFVKSLEKEYQNCRTQRMKLQAELEPEREQHYAYFRQSTGRSQ